MWLYEIVDAFFPSIYLVSFNATDNRRQVDDKLRETRRLRDAVASRHNGREISRPKTPIFTFTWMDYDIDIESGCTTHLRPADLDTAFSRPASVWGVAGTIVWGSSIDTHNATLCGTGKFSKSAFVNRSLGPVMITYPSY